MEIASYLGSSRSVFRIISYPAIFLVAAGAATIGVSRLKSASPIVDRSAVKVETVQRGLLVRHAQGLGVLVPENIRSLSASTNGRVEEVFLRQGAHVEPDTIIMKLSNPSLEHELVDAELATRKVEAELANLRVQLQAQLLNERAAESQLETDADEARLQAERDEALQKMQVGAAMNAKISRSRADSLATRLQFEKEKLGIAEEARQAQLAAKQAEVAQVQALFALKTRQKEEQQVRAGMAGVLSEISVTPGEEVTAGGNLARVTSTARLMARIHVPESQSEDIRVNQKAHIEWQNRAIAGHVARIDPRLQNGTIDIDVKMDGAQPTGVRPDVTVDGTIEIGRVQNAVYLTRALQAHSNSQVSVFKLSQDGNEAQRVHVDLGSVSTDGVEILDGLQPGDKVIVSDMSTWSKYDRVLMK